MHETALCHCCNRPAPRQPVTLLESVCSFTSPTGNGVFVPCPLKQTASLFFTDIRFFLYPTTISLLGMACLSNLSHLSLYGLAFFFLVIKSFTSKAKDTLSCCLLKAVGVPFMFMLSFFSKMDHYYH